MPLTHLAEPRPHHLPHQAPTTNITIGEDTYTVLGKQPRCAVQLFVFLSFHPLTTNITIGENTYTVLVKQLQCALLLSYLICETMEPQKCGCQ